MKLEEQEDPARGATWTELEDIGTKLPHSSERPRDKKNEGDEKAPSVETSNVQRSRIGFSARVRRWYTQGWRWGAINCAGSVTIVLLINFIISVWGSAHKNAKSEVIFEDDCQKISHINSYLHFGINALSTVLLSSSNYVMQCLSAPTRREVDTAHAKGIWLDIGVPSMRNLRYISRKRVSLWILLGLSSIPLHLFYNSMIYSSIASHSYTAYVVNHQFLDDADCLNCSGSLSIQSTGRRMHELWKEGRLDRFENKACIEQYAKIIQSSRRHLLLVTSNDHTNASSQWENFNGSHVYDTEDFASMDASGGTSTAAEAYQWICRRGETNQYHDNPSWCEEQVDELKKNANNWTIRGYPVEYCLSEAAPPTCRLHVFLPIGWLVTVLNLMKGCLILCTVFMVRENPLMTMGDAVASFIEQPDPTTQNLCLLTLKDARAHQNFFLAGPKPYDGAKYSWKDVTSKIRRITTYSLFAIALIMVLGLLIAGLDVLKDNGSGISLPDLVKLGFGTTDARTVINWGLSGTMSNILVANLPQPILSFLYMAYNGLFTCMLLGYEWSQFAHHRKGLRVSRARQGAQRTTYFLQLPYRFSLPLMVLSGVLHWLVSQSIFLVAIDEYHADERAELMTDYSSVDSFKSCGYSPIAIISVLVLGILMVAGGIGAGYLKYKPGMNLAGSCSAAMSAACHHEEWDGVEGYVSARSKLQWGVVGSTSGDGIAYGEVETVGHCAFSSKDVELPEKGSMYAGRVEDKEG